MYTQDDLIADLKSVKAFDETEAGHIRSTLELLQNTKECFTRYDFPGHITSSAWLLSPDNKSVLLTHHAILDKWLQFGGHVDGEIDVRKAAMREGQEESGINDIVLVSPDIFDVDVHIIPENQKRQEPEHTHYDIRYLFRAENTNFTVSSESKDLQWISIDDIFNLNLQPSMVRMARKWKNKLDTNQLN